MKRTYEQLEATLDQIWVRKGIKMNWLEFEGFLRNLTQSAATNEDFTKSDVIYFLNEAIGAFTRRGRAV